MLLLALCAAPLLRPEAQWWQANRVRISIGLAAALAVLDPGAASTVVGLGLLIFVLATTGEQPDWQARWSWYTTPVIAYVATLVCMLMAYLALAFLTTKAGGMRLDRALADIFLDHKNAIWPWEIPQAYSRYFEWLGDGPLYGDLNAFVFIWSIAIALAFLMPPRTNAAEGPGSRWLRTGALTLAALAPMAAWTVIYPGIMRRTPDDYALFASGFAIIAIYAMALRAVPMISRWTAKRSLRAPSWMRGDQAVAPQK